jgi:hypothetical protein
MSLVLYLILLKIQQFPAVWVRPVITCSHSEINTHDSSTTSSEQKRGARYSERRGTIPEAMTL